MSGACEKLLPSGKLGVGLTELPFTFDLVSGTGQALMETYHGVNVSVTYTLRWCYLQQHIFRALQWCSLFRAELKRSLLQQNFVKNEEVVLAKNKPIFHFNSFPRFMSSLKAKRLRVILAKDMSSWYLGKIIRHSPICPTFLPQDILSETQN